MTTTLHNIQRLHGVIENSLFMTTGTLDYARITDALIRLADAVHEYPMSDDGYEVWNIGECGHCTLDSLIVGAYWHFTEWHGGQWSQGYRALSALGQVFNPGMTAGPEPDSGEHDAYVALNMLAQELAA